MVTNNNSNNLGNQGKIKNKNDTSLVVINDVDISKVRSTADIIGEFGYFQLSLSMLAFVRYICAALMTNTGSLIAPELKFKCNFPLEEYQANKLSEWNDNNYFMNKCQIPLGDGKPNYICTSWTYYYNSRTSLSDNSTGAINNLIPIPQDVKLTLTDAFDLVCDRDLLRSFFQSVVSGGVVCASVIWGSFSDRHGRHRTIQFCFVFSLISGMMSYLANNYILFTLSRALCSFGDIGLAVTLYTIIVETLGNKYRGSICIITYTGWAFGVMLTPWLTEYMDFKKFMLLTCICHVLTLPWLLLTIKESIRWLLVNGFIEESRIELIRIANLNNYFSSKSDKENLIKQVESKFEILKRKYLILAEKRSLEMKPEVDKNKFKDCFMSVFGAFSKINQLIKSKELIVVSITMIWITFNCELLYMTTILINSDIGDNIKLNYFIGGIMENIASIIAILLINQVTRKLSIICILLTISSTCFILALTHQLPSISIWVLNSIKLAVSTLSSVIYVTTTELFPTNLRQTGFGVVATIGGLGSVVAPFVRTELVNLIGFTSVMFILVILPITAALIIPFFLIETKGIELPDDIDDLGCEIVDNDSKPKTASSIPKAEQTHITTV